MGELSHRTRARGRVQPCICAVRRPPSAVRPSAAAVRPAPPGWYDPRMPSAYTSELAGELAGDVLDRFLRYARVDTQSVRDRTGSPSTPGQLDLLRMLVAELREIGLEDAAIDDHGYVYATLPATNGSPHAVGLIAHVDVSPDAPGAGVEPIVHRDYDGARVELPRGGTVLDPSDMPVLASKVGHDVVTSSGDTLLGADDKAGVAEIMAAVAYLAAHPELPRATMKVGFTPDEEIGEGATLFDVERFGAACAYTLDGSQPGEIQDETFSGTEVAVIYEGVDIHPGWATGKLVNAVRLAGRLLARLPADRLTPETTQEREGFIHPYVISGDAGRAEVRFIARDFDDAVLAEHIALIRRVAEEVAAEEPRSRVTVLERPQYPNMRRFVDGFPQVVEVAERAIRAEGIEPIKEPIRGGTDGSILSARGLPTPNLFTGGHEYHSVREWASVHDMASAAAVVVRLAGLWAEEPAAPAG
jgi:tripeptide aminopeptidase